MTVINSLQKVVLGSYGCNQSTLYPSC